MTPGIVRASTARECRLQPVTNANLPEPQPSGLASGWVVQPESTPEPEPQTPTPAATQASSTPGLSNIALMLLGVLGGVYLLYTWAWFETASVNAEANAATASDSGILGVILQQIMLWIAPLAPLLWFITSILAAKRRTGVIALLLILGLIILLPFPVLTSILGGAA